MNTQLQAIRDLYDKAQADAESDGCVPEGIATIVAERIRAEHEIAQQRVIDENTPRAA